MRITSVATLLKKISAIVLCVFLLSGCGNSDTQECIYSDGNIQFSVMAPIDWSYAVHKQVQDENGQNLYDQVYIVLYPEREESNRICIFHQENGNELTSEETGISIELNSKLAGTMIEDSNEQYMSQYIILNNGEYGILVFCRTDFYDENKSSINDVLSSLKIK